MLVSKESIEMSKIRVATFNVENLLQRFDFHMYGNLKKERALRLLGVEQDDEDYMRLRKAFTVGLTDDSRQQTAQAIIETKADIVCLQEIESREALDEFHEGYLEKSNRAHYGWRRVKKGNDIRGINVGVLSKDRIDVKSHKNLTFEEAGLTPLTNDLIDYGVDGDDKIFRRDCLEVNLKVDGNSLTIFVCHFKSMMGKRSDSRCMREAESRAVRWIINDKFKEGVNDEDWIIAGDLNDYIMHNGHPDHNHGLDPLFQNNFSYNLLDTFSAKDRWTHHYSGDDSIHQLDYLLASPSLWEKNKKPKMEVVRRGLPYRVPNLTKLQRFPRVGFDRPKASDHCPVVVELELGD
jgi:endonuclease/exonuclease/phosphatase family metal-dependent hydrolase